MVYAKEPLGGPETVLDYLARSGTHRVAISNERSRAWVAPGCLPSNDSVAVTAADVDLTAPANADKARCAYLTPTGALTANRNVIVPNGWQGTVFCNNSGAFTTTFKTAARGGVVVAQGKRAMLLADGTKVVRVTPDTWYSGARLEYPLPYHRPPEADAFGGLFALEIHHARTNQ